MNIEKIKTRMKVLLGIARHEFETATLADGSEVSFDALEINREIYDSEGNPLKEGEYVLSDGTKVKVDMNGVVKEIERTDGETTKEEVVDEQMGCGEAKVEKLEEVVDETTETETVTEGTTEPQVTETETVEEKIAKLESTVDELYALLLALTEKVKDDGEKVETIGEEFRSYKAQPSARPIAFHSEGKEVAQSLVYERLEKLNRLKK